LPDCVDELAVIQSLHAARPSEWFIVFLQDATPDPSVEVGLRTTTIVVELLRINSKSPTTVHLSRHAFRSFSVEISRSRLPNVTNHLRTFETRMKHLLLTVWFELFLKSHARHKLLM
jgi:hypothetical protein